MNGYSCTDVGLGSTWALTDLEGEVKRRYSYDAWGIAEVRYQSGLVDNRFRYVGELGYYDDWNSAGLSLLGARYYRPAIGRFISVDPIGYGGGDLNLYPYAGNSPVCLVDPKGECHPVIILGLIALVVVFTDSGCERPVVKLRYRFLPQQCKELLRLSKLGVTRNPSPADNWYYACQACCHDLAVGHFLGAGEASQDCEQRYCDRGCVPEEVFTRFTGTGRYKRYQREQRRH